MIHLITFSDASMSESARLCCATAAAYGVDLPRRMSYEELMKSPFGIEHKDLLSQPRGLGYWAWKPYVIRHIFETAKDGDIVIYADAGIEFIDHVSHIIERMDQDIFLFGNNWEHAHWCKRDIVEAIWPQPWEKFGKQAQASAIFCRVSSYTCLFLTEWLGWCLLEWKCADGFGGGRLIDDSPGWSPNHPEFQENRHDQAILTTLAYREGIKLHWWPAIYNDGQFTYEKLPVYAGDDYPPLFHHHRKRNHEWRQCA